MMNPEDQSRKKKKIQSADEVARAMAANMAANMADPDFPGRLEQIKDEVRAQVIAERKRRQQKGD